MAWYCALLISLIYHNPVIGCRLRFHFSVYIYYKFREPVDYLVTMEQLPVNGEIFSFERLGVGEWKFVVQELENAEIKKISEKYDILCNVFGGFYSDRE